MMKTGQNIQCQACGASSVIMQANKPLLECEYCGAAMTYSINPAIQTPSKPAKLGLLLVIIPVLVIMLMVIFWIIFQNTRHNRSLDSYQAEVNIIAEKLPQERIEVTQQTSKQDPVESVNDINQSVVIQSQVAGETANGGKYWVVDLKNTSDQIVSRPGVMLSLFNEKGERIEEQGGWSLREQLQPGEDTVVLLYLDKQPDGVADQKITTFASNPSQLRSKQVEIKVKSFNVKQKNNQHEIIGDVVNNQSQFVKYVRLMVVAYDADDKPVGIGNAFSTVKELVPDQESGFKVRVGTFLQGEPVTWKVWALGRQ